MGAALTLWAGHVGKGRPMHHVPPTDWEWGDSPALQPLSVGHHPGYTLWALRIRGTATLSENCRVLETHTHSHTHTLTCANTHGV